MAIPTDGLVFYAPLAEDKATAETGQTLTKNRELIFEYVQGFQCVFVPKGTGGVPGYSISPQPQLTSSQAQSISIWMKVANTWTTRDSDEAIATPLLAVVAAGGSYGNIAKLRFRSEMGGFDCNETNFLEWHHYVMTFSPENIFKGYVDGILVVEQTSNPSGTSNYPYTIGGGRNWGAYFAGARIYDRELNQDEVTSLYNEFNEDAGGGDSGNTGFLIDGLFLSSSKPKLGQKGLLLDNKYFLPLVEGSGGSAEYYRCASVDTSAKTWTGYRAVLNDGVYTFEDTVTSGLSYTSVTPQVGKIYSQDALVYGANLYQGIPTDSLVFYSPLSEFTGTAETGQTLNLSGTPEFLAEDGIPCMKISNSNSYISMPDQSTLPMGSSPRTVSIWAKKTESGTFHMIGYGKGATAQAFLCLMSETYMKFDGVNGGTSQDVTITDEWHNYIYVYSGSAITMYLDGIKLGNDTAISLNTVTGYPLGAVFGNTPERNYTQLISGYVAACRIYSRVLDDAEIAALASEFTPTQVNA